MLGDGFLPESSPPRERFPSRRSCAMGPASSAGGYEGNGVVGFQAETMDESVGELGFSFLPLATS